MAWRDQMQQPSFRGVPFRVTRSDGQIGRRTVVHQYPNKDESYVEDLGKLARVFTLTCFVLGPDYMDARDALETAFEQEGPGELIHPWRGRMTVSVTDCRPSETVDEGGKQGWSVTFTQSGKNVQPNIRPDTYAVVNAAADEAVLVSEQDFADVFTVDALPAFVEQDAFEMVNGVMDETLATAKGMLPDMTIMPAFIRQAQGTLGKLTQLFRLPTSLASLVSGQIAGLLGLGNSPLAALRALFKLFGYQNPGASSNNLTSARIQQAANRKAIADLTRRTAIIEAARASAAIEYESTNQATEIRETITDALETESLTAADPVYLALTDLRVAVIRDINARSANLASVVPFTPKATLPALVIAHSLYGDASREADIVSRNRISHPGFIPGGQLLEVLTND